ncbi:MAG: hypothetical protein IJ799_02460 [Bacteroidales bacterium]|nr:hypothetical protein [Bacteroidales bacterium]
MRKIFSTIFITFAAVLCAGAQTMYDAMTFSETSYYGTARSLSMGNSLTAVGSDLGSIGINPAGSAVTPYSVFTLTPGVSISASSSAWSTLDDGNYGWQGRDSKSKFIFPNIGMTMNFNTGNRRGVKRYSFGFLVNSTANHLEQVSASCGSNDRTSMLASFAANASGVPFSDLDVVDPYNNTTYPWNTVMAVKSDMISTYDSYTDQYLGATEKIDGSNVISLGGPLSQRAVTVKQGSRSDMLMNFGMDISDNFFVGINVGIPVMRYYYSEAFYENALDPAEFLIEYEGGASTCFKAARYQYNYRADVDGIYAKIGAIWLPAPGVRLGAAIKTPTSLTVEEEWMVDGVVNYTTAPASSSTSPTGEWAYNLSSPWEANFGAAVTFGNYGLLSVDYEMTDYSVMKLSEMHDDGFYGSDTYYVVNRLNKLFCGVQHSLRFGAEFKPLPELALRAGWTMTTSPEKFYKDNLGLTVTASEYEKYFDDFENGVYTLSEGKYYDDKVMTFSAGIGYSSPGSFFMDLGARVSKYPVTYRKPYADYIYTDSGDLDVASPVIRSSKSLVDILLTLGWRF